MPGPIFVNDISDDLIPALVTEVDINIRHRNPLGIKKAFKEQIVFHRINIRNPQDVSNQTSGGRTPARSGCDPLPVRVGNEIPHNQEIIREAHSLNDAELVLKTLLQFRSALRISPPRGRLVARLQPLPAELSQIPGRCLAFRDGTVGRQNMPAEFELKLTLIRNHASIADSLWNVGEQAVHFLLIFQIELAGRDLQPFFVVHRFPRTDTDQHILNLGVLLLQIMHIVCGHQTDPCFLGQLNQQRIDLLLLRQPMILKLKVEVFSKH